MEVVINLFRHRLVDPGDGFEIGQAGGGDAAGRAEVQQQRAFTLPPDSGNLVQRRTGDVGGTLGALAGYSVSLWRFRGDWIVFTIMLMVGATSVPVVSQGGENNEYRSPRFTVRLDFIRYES